MSSAVPHDPDDPRHIAHVFGDCFAGTVLEPNADAAEQQWKQLETTPAEDWQMLFVRAYAGHRGAA